MGIYVMKASALKELLEQHMPDANDFGNEVIPGAREMGYPVQVSSARAHTDTHDQGLGGPIQPGFMQTCTARVHAGIHACIYCHTPQALRHLQLQQCGVVVQQRPTSSRAKLPYTVAMPAVEGSSTDTLACQPHPHPPGSIITSWVRAAFYILLCACVCVPVCVVVQAYAFQGYWEDIGTIDAFYHANLALVNTDGQANFSFYDKDAPIYTMSRFLPPSKVMDGEWTAGPCRGTTMHHLAAGRAYTAVVCCPISNSSTTTPPVLGLVRYVRLGTPVVKVESAQSGEWL